MRVVYLMLLLITLGLGACGKKSGPAEGIPQTGTQGTPAADGTPVVTGAPTAAPAPPPVVAIDEHMPPIDESKGSPELMLQGQLRPLNAEQDVSGNVLLYRMPDQSHLLRIEFLRVADKAPDLDVALARMSEPKSQADLQGVLAVGPLKGPSGNMNYVIPKSEDVSELHSLVLSLHDGSRIFASASLSR